MSIRTSKWTSLEAGALLRAARKLPEHDRLHLADELRASVPSTVAAEWDEEILQRAEAYERGELKTVDGNAVFDRIEAKYGR